MAAANADFDLKKAQLEAALEHGIDLLGRRIFLHGDVGEETIGKAVRGMYLMADIDSTLAIELYVTSYGGSLDDAFALHDVTRTIRCPVHTIALGKCQSAAPLLVACGKKGQRWATESTVFMLHDCRIEGDVDDHPSSLKILAEMADQSMKRYAKLLGKYTKKDARHWQRLFNRKDDSYFTAEEAEEWGLVDGVWCEKA